MNLYFSISIVFFIVFVGLSVDLVRQFRKTKHDSSIVVDEQEAGQVVAARIDAEEERESSTGATFSDKIERKITFQEHPLVLEEITSVERNFIPGTAPLVIICPPTIEGMIGAALLKRCFHWAEVRVIHKKYFVKSLWTFTRMIPRPEYLLIVGTNAGYVHGRRLIQTLTGLQENGLRVAWYDNQSWLPIIAKNIEKLCFDFVLADSKVGIGELIFRRFDSMLDADSRKIIALSSLKIDERNAADTWTSQWLKLLAHSIEEGSGIRRSKLVSRLSQLSQVNVRDRFVLFQYSRKIGMTLQILDEQRHIVDLGPGLRLSIIDLRPVHREKTHDGTTYIVFRGRRPIHDLPRLVFEHHQTQLLFVVHSLLRCELYRADSSSIRLSRLIDVTTVEGKPVQVEGHDGHLNINFDIPLSRRFQATLSLKWPVEIPALIDIIRERLVPS